MSLIDLLKNILLNDDEYILVSIYPDDGSLVYFKFNDLNKLCKKIDITSPTDIYYDAKSKSITFSDGELESDYKGQFVTIWPLNFKEAEYIEKELDKNNSKQDTWW